MMIMAGCSSNATNPIEISDSDNNIPIVNSFSTNETGHSLQGIFIAEFDIENLTASVMPNREMSSHLNVTSLLPSPSISVQGWDSITETLSVDVTIHNPYIITGYDVRLIIYTDSIGHLLSNPDDWTLLYDIPGGEIMNPFIAYAKSEPLRAFAGPVSHMESLEIIMPGGNFSVQFAVDVSFPLNCQEPYEIYQFSQLEELFDRPDSTADISCSIKTWHPQDPAFLKILCAKIMGPDPVDLTRINDTDFDRTITNTLDAEAGVYIALLEASSTGPVKLYDKVELTVTEKQAIGWAKIFDDDVWIPGIETDQYGNVYFALNDTHKLVKYDTSSAEVWNRDIDSLGSLGRILDIDLNPFDDFVHASAFAYYCGTGYDSGACSIKSSKENPDVSVFGYQCLGDPVGSWDITTDNGGGTYTSSGPEYTGYFYAITKWDENVNTVWTNEFINYDGNLIFKDLLYVHRGTLFAIGHYQGDSVDFDPTSGELILHPMGFQDAFISTWNSVTGDFMSIRVWGGYGDTTAWLTASNLLRENSGCILVGGTFSGTVDFDTGIFTQRIVSSTNGRTNMFVSKFNWDLSFVDVMTIKGDGRGTIEGMAVDESDNLYISGYFEDTLDFDPGHGTAERTALGYTDGFLAKYSSTREFQWVRIWGTTDYDWLGDVAYDEVNDYIYVCGATQTTMDFNPGEEVFDPLIEDHTAFLMRILPNGYWDE
jgi:hypothetical protein